MPKGSIHITPAELEIMKVIWERGSATVPQALDDLSAGSDQPPAYTTVMTMMKNLAQKGILDVDDIEDFDMWSLAKLYLRAKKLRQDIVELREFSARKRQRQAERFLGSL